MEKCKRKASCCAQADICEAWQGHAVIVKPSTRLEEALGVNAQNMMTKDFVSLDLATAAHLPSVEAEQHRVWQPHNPEAGKPVDWILTAITSMTKILCHKIVCQATLQ